MARVAEAFYWSVYASILFEAFAQIEYPADIPIVAHCPSQSMQDIHGIPFLHSRMQVSWLLSQS